MDTTVWLKKIEDMESCLLVKEYQDGKQINSNIYCWNEKSGWLINLERKRLRELSSRVMRRQIYGILGGNEHGYK